jgi:hypothetical protein
MSAPHIALVTLSKSLRVGIERRLPRARSFRDLTGKKYARCAVVGFAGYKGAFAVWLCRCRCGSFFVREGAYLARPRRQGCGCLRAKKSPVPGYVRTAWVAMKSRCYNCRDDQYHAYGKRGIKVCKRWLRSVEKFAEDMGPRPSPAHFICRRDKGADFTPKNCFWGTYRDRQLRRAREIAHNGKTQNLAGWADELGITREAMRYRVNECLRRGIDVSLALTTPVGKRLPKNSAFAVDGDGTCGRRTAANPQCS